MVSTQVERFHKAGIANAIIPFWKLSAAMTNEVKSFFWVISGLLLTPSIFSPLASHFSPSGQGLGWAYYKLGNNLSRKKTFYCLRTGPART